MNFKVEGLVEQLNIFWGQLFTYNHDLMKRSENDKLYGTESFIDVMDFYLTSHAQCFIKDFLLKHIGSQGMILTARCFIEGLALKRMYENGKIKDFQIELLHHQVHIIEYNYYKEFDDIADKILLPEKLVQDKDKSAKFFQEKLSDKFDKKQIKKIIKTNQPFLCNSHINYRKLVAESLGEEYAKIYGLYSQVIHPSVNDFYMNDDVWQKLYNILFLMMEEYKSLPISQLTFKNYYTFIYGDNITLKYDDIVQQECKILMCIRNVFNSFFNKNYVSDTLTSISLFLSEMCSDKLLGMCEQIKSKWKIAIDMFASFYTCYISHYPNEEYFKLLKEHECIQYKRNFGEEISTAQVYDIYKKMYPNGVNQDIFEKNFLKLCGYTIDENGNTKTLTNIVKDFIENFVSSDSKKIWDRIMLLDYVESQMISHANGYMWYANSGSWGDVNNIIKGMDMCLMFIIKTLLSMFKAHKAIEETNYYKPIINILRNSLKRIELLCDEKVEILKIQGITI